MNKTGVNPKPTTIKTGFLIMAMYEKKFFDRDGMIFSNRDITYDLSSLRVLHSGVDTVKQLFDCVPKIEVLQRLDLIDSNSIINLGGIDWLFTRSGKRGGYQYLLKNLDLGYVVLLKSFFNESDQRASHLKIECTPQLIYENTPQSLQLKLLKIADIFVDSPVPNGVAIHLCVDVKNFDIPENFDRQLITRSKRTKSFSTSTTEINKTVINNRGESYLFGSASGLQLNVYDKVTESIHSDKINFVESIWSTVPSVDDPFTPEYQVGDNVTRIEFRYHQSVISEFSHGTKDADGNYLDLTTYEDCSDHLTALFQYGLNNFRFHHSSSYIHPVWQYLLDDLVIFSPSPHLLYKRAKKAVTNQNDLKPIKRNVGLWLGNCIRLYYRKRFNPEFVANYIIDSGMTSELEVYFNLGRDRDTLYHHVFNLVSEKFKLYELSGV